jgi:hypothetical protein
MVKGNHAQPTLTLKVIVSAPGKEPHCLEFHGKKAYENMLGVQCLHVRGLKSWAAGTELKKVKFTCKLYFSYGNQNQLALHEMNAECAIRFRNERLRYPDGFLAAIKQFFTDRFVIGVSGNALNPSQCTYGECQRAWHNTSRKVALVFA